MRKCLAAIVLEGPGQGVGDTPSVVICEQRRPDAVSNEVVAVRLNELPSTSELTLPAMMLDMTETASKLSLYSCWRRTKESTGPSTNSWHCAFAFCCKGQIEHARVAARGGRREPPPLAQLVRPIANEMRTRQGNMRRPNFSTRCDDARSWLSIDATFTTRIGS